MPPRNFKRKILALLLSNNNGGGNRNAPAPASAFPAFYLVGEGNAIAPAEWGSWLGAPVLSNPNYLLPI